MMRVSAFVLLVTILIACNNRNQDVNLQESLNKDTVVSIKQILFAEPQLIDSSPIVIYPLILEKENYGGYGSSSSGERTSYWNLIFYNTETGGQQLLTPNKKMLIYSINHGSASASQSSRDVWTNGINVFKNNIIYTAVVKDYNTNKQLDQNDPEYLYISNKDGSNFRQISPDDYNVYSWNVVKGTSKIIMQGQKDENGDKKFDEKDSVIPLVVDVNAFKPGVETFSAGYVDSLKQKLVSIWKAK